MKREKGILEKLGITEEDINNFFKKAEEFKKMSLEEESYVDDRWFGVYPNSTSIDDKEYYKDSD